MNRFDAHWMAARVEAYVDDDLPPAERARFEAALADDPAWQHEVALARRIQVGLRALPAPPCPPRVLAALPHADRPPRPAPLPRRRWPTLRPALAGLALVGMVALSALPGRRPAPPPPVAEAEVEQALADVKWTLAYLSSVSRRTGEAVRRDVEDRVVAPARAAVAPSASAN